MKLNSVDKHVYGNDIIYTDQPVQFVGVHAYVVENKK